MSSKVEVLEQEQEVENSYKAIIGQDQEQNKNRAQSLAILPDAAKQQIVEASKYSSYFPNPITKPFMRQYILAKLEFPTPGSELAQSLTELNVRIDNLFNDAYTFEKAKLEAESLGLDMEELDEQLSKAVEGSIEQRKLLNQRKLKNLEVVNKNHSLKKIELAAMARYNEAMGWKGCVEDILQEMGKTSVDEVDFNQIRMDEMAAKIKNWGKLHAQGALEITPSKLQAIDSNTEKFAEGVVEGKEQIRQIQHQQEQARRLLAQAEGAAPFSNGRQ